MPVKAYKVEKLAKGPSFKPNDLIECIFKEEEIDEDETEPEEFSDKDFENRKSVMYIVW